MIEQLKIRNWLQGQATLEAWIEQLESQKASEEDINKLKEDAKTEGLGVAISNAKNLSLSLAAQQFINQQAYDIYRQGEYQYVSAPNNNKGKNNPFAGVSAGGGVSTTVSINNLTNTSGSLISFLPSWFLSLVIGITILAGIVILDSIIDPRGHATNPSPTCKASYAECFNQNQRLDFTNVIRPTGNNLDAVQFKEMLDVIYSDLNSKWRTPFDPSRMVYDTPFWNGNGRIQLFQPEYPDEILCLDGVCAPRSAINYTGVGMYSAHVGEPLWLGKAEVFIWNGLVWGNTATQEELYFFEYGYNAYVERDTNE